MRSSNAVLSEINGSWYFQGISLKVGDRVMIDGVTWKVLRFGRSQANQIPFVWIQNDRLGITVYAPSLVENGPLLSPIEKAFTPRSCVEVDVKYFGRS